MKMPERDTKRVSIPHSDTHATWKRLHNDVKRTTHMFEGRFIDPFETDNASDHPLNFECGVRNTCIQGKSTKSPRQRQSCGNRLNEEAFDTIRKQHTT